MKCVVCQAETAEGRVSRRGFICSAACSQQLAAQAEKLYKTLLQEPIGEIPRKLSVENFEWWSLKVAVHFLDWLRSEGKIELIEDYLQDPEFMALRIKELVIEQLPEGLVTTQRNPGLFPPDYFHRFTRPVRRDELVHAALATGMFDPFAFGTASS